MTTIQSLIQRSGTSIAAELLTRGSWMVLVDEAQYYPDNSSTPFVEAIKRIITKPAVKFVMPMTATPIRSDKRFTFFGEPDLIVTPLVAVDEGAIRYVKTYLGEYDLDITMKDDPTPIRISTTDIAAQLKTLKDEGISSIREWEVRYRVRYHNKYVSRILHDALERYYRKNSEHPGRHQIIIFAMTVAHAKHLAELMNKLVGVNPQEEEPLRFADYVGDTIRVVDQDGTAVPNDAFRSEAENKAVMDAFKTRQLPCLVQVAKAGVGFDHRYCSIIIFLNNIGETVLLEQQVGRGLRRDMEIAKGRDVLDIFAGTDHPGAEFLKQLTEMMPEPEEPNGGGGGGGGGGGLLGFPTWCLIDVEQREVKMFTPYGVFDAAKKEDLARAIEIAKGHVGGDETKIYAAVRQLFEEKKAAAAPMAHAQALEQAQLLVKAATRTVVSNVIRMRKRNGQTVESSLPGDLKKAINKRWRGSAGQGHGSMTESDFKSKFQWLEELNETIASGMGIPRWLDL